MSQPRPQVLFVHGLWLHATSWQPWVDLFTTAGYDASAPGWPGDRATVADTRAHPDDLAGHGIDDVVAHYARLITGAAATAATDGVADPDRLPILVGHSFGGAIVEKLLGQGLAAAAVAIDPAPIKGVQALPLSSLRSAFPVLKSPGNAERAVSLTAEQFRYAFGNAVSEEESNELYERWTIPAPGKPLFQAASANLSRHSEAAVDTERSDRGPLLLIAGGQDHTAPEAITRGTLKQYRHSTAVTEMQELDDRGHSLTIDHGWQGVAEVVLSWLQSQGLSPETLPQPEVV
jgi:alpha-beta hydrolase superfamily lysophospholipase